MKVSKLITNFVYQSDEEGRTYSTLELSENLYNKLKREVEEDTTCTFQSVGAFMGLQIRVIETDDFMLNIKT